MQRVDAGAQLNISSARCCAEPAPADPKDLARLRLALRDDVAHRLRFVRMADQQVRRHADEDDRHEVALDDVVQLRLQARRERVAVDVRHQQHRAVARLLGDVVGGEHAGDAGLVLDDHLLLPHLGQLGALRREFVRPIHGEGRKAS